MNRYKSGFVMFLVILAVLVPTPGVSAQEPVSAETVAAAAEISGPEGVRLDPQSTLILFYSDACPHCHNQMRWMEAIRGDFPEIDFRLFEIQVTNNAENQAYFADMMELYGSNTQGWPRTIIGDRVFIGFDPGTGPMQYADQYQAWIGYRNQLYEALERIANG